MSNFRSYMHIIAGLLYLVAAAAIIKYQSFLNFELSIGMTFALGGLLLLYGVFRIYRGYKDLKLSKAEALEEANKIPENRP